jgi:hypothetical protein
LIRPPVNEKLKYDVKAPLSRWRQLTAFDTAQQCESERRLGINQAKKEFDEARKQLVAAKQFSEEWKDAAHFDSAMWENWKIALEARCIASDDPRLK